MPRKSKTAQPGSAQSGAVNRGNAEHYRWGNDCDAWYLVNDERLSVIEEFMPPIETANRLVEEMGFDVDDSMNPATANDS